MTRVLTFLIAIAGLAIAAAWLADRPGEVVLEWQGWRIETSLMVLAVALVLLVVAILVVWALVRMLVAGPARVAEHFRERRRERGFRALSRGMIAAAGGDRRQARHYAGEAHRLMRGQPLTLLLEAQAAQLAGDRTGARRAFETMLADRDTELLGLRGLFIEAQRAGDEASARLYAERAAARGPALAWAGNALLEFQTREGDWEAALATVARNADARLFDKKQAKRLRAVLLTAQALQLEDEDADAALKHALDAHRLAPELVPAAVVAGRLSAAAGNTRQATRLLEATWKLSPHPDIAEVYAHARPGDSARDRLKRARALAGKLPGHGEGRIAIAVAAIEARDWKAARSALAPLLEAPSQRVCLLMAEIEDGEAGDAGRAREWLARAARAPRDPAWTADGFVSEHWLPVSPVSGRLDAFEWKVPVVAIAGEEARAAEPLPAAPQIELEPEPQTTPVPPAPVPSPAAGEEPASEPPAPREDPTPKTSPPRNPAGAEADAEDDLDLPRPPDDPGPEPERPEDQGPARRFL